MAVRMKDGSRVTRTDDLIEWWVERACMPGKSDAHEWISSIHAEGDALYHYGRHFCLGEILRSPNGRPRLFLLNGDDYAGTGGFGPSTGSRQMDLRRHVAATNVPALTVPFSALGAAGIKRDSIRPVEIIDERYTTHDVYMDEPPGPLLHADVPEDERRWKIERGVPDHASIDYADRSYAIRTDDGRYHFRVKRHWLGDALFKATTFAYDRATGVSRKRTRLYLSSFDYNEPRPLYFLCELPTRIRRDGGTVPVRPLTVKHAIDDLRPDEVVKAQNAGIDVIRQGDVFALPTSLTTRDLTRQSNSGIAKSAHVLGTNHKVTDTIVTVDGDTYGRGRMRHDPGAHRGPDHRTVTLGDGKTWYRLLKNTVPMSGTRRGLVGAQMAQSGQSRAWTAVGTVD